jgi:hypothetical protein
MTKATISSPRKAAANRRNASRSTGPRTPRGKARSRLNAMKHGILASQVVIATIEGYAQRKLFEAIVEGLIHDFEPVGTYEQLLVQEIAACFWRERRLLAFENRAALDEVDRPAEDLINLPLDRPLIRPTIYLHQGRMVPRDCVYSDSGLDGPTLPNEADTMRIIRYQASINRTRDRAVAALREMRRARKGVVATREASAPAPEFAIDQAAMRRNQQRVKATLVPAMVTVGVYNQFEIAQLEVEAAQRKAEKQNDETKPKRRLTDEQIEQMRRTLYEGVTGNEMPEESVEEPAAEKVDPDKPPES